MKFQNRMCRHEVVILQRIYDCPHRYPTDSIDKILALGRWLDTNSTHVQSVTSLQNVCAISANPTGLLTECDQLTLILT